MYARDKTSTRSSSYSCTRIQTPKKKKRKTKRRKIWIQYTPSWHAIDKLYHYSHIIVIITLKFIATTIMSAQNLSLKHLSIDNFYVVAFIILFFRSLSIHSSPYLVFSVCASHTLQLLLCHNIYTHSLSRLFNSLFYQTHWKYILLKCCLF